VLGVNMYMHIQYIYWTAMSMPCAHVYDGIASRATAMHVRGLLTSAPGAPAPAVSDTDSVPPRRCPALPSRGH
jgi:hypothetical protein